MSIASKYVDTFLDGMGTSGVALYNKVIGAVRGLDYNETGLVSGSYNTAVVSDIAYEMSAFFDSPTYEARLQALQDSLPKITEQVLDDAEKKFGRQVSEDILQQVLFIQERYAGELSGVLDDTSVEPSIIDPFINTAFMAIGMGEELSLLESETLKMQDSFYNYYITKVTTLVEMFEREIMETINSGYVFTHYIYAGPKDARNRTFCHTKADGIYTKEEIEAWADEEWDGQIPGTTADNIFVNAGGYNCRHTFVPYIKKK